MADRPVNLLFVCTANVCRSPLAAGLMAFNAKQLSIQVNISSASVDHEVRETHPTTVAMLAARGVTLGRTTSQPISNELIDGADIVLVMTADHAKAVVGRFPHFRHKVFVLNHFAFLLQPSDAIGSTDAWLQAMHGRPRDYARDESWDIQDPIQQSDEVYRAVEEEIDGATTWIATVLSTVPGSSPR